MLGFGDGRLHQQANTERSIRGKIESLAEPRQCNKLKWDAARPNERTFYRVEWAKKIPLIWRGI